MNIVIFYESIEREMQNALLLKCELVKRGHNVYVWSNLILTSLDYEIEFNPDVVLVPYLYEDYQLEMFKKIFIKKIPKIINLQYEQILTNRHNETGFHIPKGLNRNAIHLCWNKDWENKLLSGDISPKNTKVVGSLNIDMCMNRFSSIYYNKKYLCNRYKLNFNKKLIIFISSFSMTNLTEYKKYFDSRVIGEEYVLKREVLDYESRMIILDWIERYIKENDCEFIYRPHPAEYIDENIIKIREKYFNFHIIGDDSIRTWIKNCDKINIWHSTSIAEIYFMRKTCSVLRPIEMPEFLQNGILDNAKTINTYEEFCNFNNNEVNEFPIDKDLILEHFYIDEEEYAYEKICDLLEEVVENNISMDLY